MIDFVAFFTGDNSLILETAPPLLSPCLIILVWFGFVFSDHCSSLSHHLLAVYTPMVQFDILFFPPSLTASQRNYIQSHNYIHWEDLYAVSSTIICQTPDSYQ